MSDPRRTRERRGNWKEKTPSTFSEHRLDSNLRRPFLLTPRQSVFSPRTPSRKCCPSSFTSVTGPSGSTFRAQPLSTSSCPTPLTPDTLPFLQDTFLSLGLSLRTPLLSRWRTEGSRRNLAGTGSPGNFGRLNGLLRPVLIPCVLRVVRLLNDSKHKHT